MASIDRFMAWLEGWLQGLVEGGTSWLVPGGRHRRELAAWLVQVMHSSARLTPAGTWQAPDVYQLVLPEAAAIRVDAALLAELGQALEAEAGRRGLVLLHPPAVRMLADAACSSPRLQVSFSDQVERDTTTVEIRVQDELLPENASPPGAYLVIEGRRTTLLTSPVVTIGRDPGNQLVLDDLRVSRTHAQLRLVQGQYVIFDLQSTGGTSVNGQLIAQHTLLPGDVISLAGVSMVYGQELAAQVERTQKLPPEPPTPEVL